MRRFLTLCTVAAFIALAPTLALAGNQEIAEQIAGKLRNSGQMVDYKIGVKYQDGTAWLRGRVASEAQMQNALRLAFEVPEVDRVVNEMTIVGESAESNPLRGDAPAKLGLAGRIEASMSTGTQPKPLPIREEAPSYASPVPSSYAPASARQTAAEEPQELPRQAAPQRRAAPISGPRMAMVQQAPRGPVDPNAVPRPMYTAAASRAGVAPARYDQPCLPNYAWPSYAAYPNYAAVTYPKQYSPTAWPYIGPFYPYPQVPLGWRKVTLEWDDGWWFLDFKDQPASAWHR
jgi:hypothetical protein